MNLPDYILKEEATNEVKDKIKILATDIEHLRATLRVIASEAIKGVLPPLNPAALEGELSYCKDLISRIRTTSPDLEKYGSIRPQENYEPPKRNMKEAFVHRPADMEKIEERADDVGTIESSLEIVGNILTQRREGTSLEDLTYRFPERFEVTGLHKVYFSIDILTHNYMARAVDTSKSLVDLPNTILSHEYSYVRNFISIPRSEIYRTRNWPMVAHEVGHHLLTILALIHQKVEDEKRAREIIRFYRDLVSKGTDSPSIEFIAKELNLPLSVIERTYKKIREKGPDQAEVEVEEKNVDKILRGYFRVKDRKGVEEVWNSYLSSIEVLFRLFQRKMFAALASEPSSYVTEHLCDVIAVVLAGPAFVLSLALADRSETAKFSRTHPPDATRSYLALLVLRKVLGISDDRIKRVERRFDQLLDSNASLRAYKKTLSGLLPSFKGIAFGLLPPRARYSVDDWNTVNSTCEKGNIGNLDKMQPYQTMNLIWCGRIRLYTHEREAVGLSTYEAKTFELVTHNLFGQYGQTFFRIYPLTNFLGSGS